MLSFFKNIFGKSRSGGDRYEREKTIARSGDIKKRITLASNSRTHQEILYYLAEHDPDPDVRMAVARNDSTPVQASSILATDSHVDVRLALAQRLVRLLPDISQEEQSQLYAFAVQALGTLALDEVLKIRIALSSTLKDHAHAPPKVVGQLARDIERDVSEPVLRVCSAISDEDLIDILKSHPASWAVQAIAARPTLAAPVSAAVIDTDDRPAGKILLENQGAELQVDTLRIIVEKARNYPEWQASVAVHKTLPPDLAQELAEFADSSVREILLQRTDFDEQTASEIANVFRRRLDYAGDQERYSGETPGQRVKRLNTEGRLDEDTISDGLAMRDRDFVYAALALKARTTVSNVQRIFAMKAAKPVVALCWQAGLSMRFALQLQKEIAHIQPKDLIYPRDGTDYPLSEDEINWQLEFLGLKAA